MIQLVGTLQQPFKVWWKRWKGAHLPFTQCTDRDQKDQYFLTSPNESALLFSFSVISSDLGGMFCLTNLTILLLEATQVSQIFGVDLIEFSKICNNHDIHQKALCLIHTALSPLLLIPQSWLSSSASHLLSLCHLKSAQQNLLALFWLWPLLSPSTFSTRGTTNSFSLTLYLESQSETQSSERSPL